ncbi:MAG: DegV family protein [Ruminococcaceae bacterium]|nr:DegV family protein [Oscillospiraceae bacterium]
MIQTKIIADSCCDLTPALANLLDVDFVSFKMTVGERHFTDDKNIDLKDLLHTIKACKTAASTACPSPDEYREAMEKYDASFVVTISSQLSGSYNAAMVARDMVLEEYPDKKIAVIDSKSATSGETLIAMRLHEALLSGKSFEKIEAETREFVDKMTTLFVLEDLSTLIKNGRISKAAGLLGTMLNLRPIMGTIDGEIIAHEKVRGTQNAMRRLVETVAEKLVAASKGSIVLVMSYCNCIERATELRRELLEKCTALGEVIIVPAAGLSTVYENDGGIVLAF